MVDFGQDMQKAARENYERIVRERMRVMDISRELAEYLLQLENRIRELEKRS